MTTRDTPKDGDFASYLQKREKPPPAAAPEAHAAPAADPEAPVHQPRQTIQQVLVDGEEPTDEFLEDWNAAEALPELSDEEFERQALEAPGDDSDPNTPE